MIEGRRAIALRLSAFLKERWLNRRIAQPGNQCYTVIEAKMSNTDLVRQQVIKYLTRARQALAASQLAVEHGDYITAVNRAYYAIFYAANAMLSTKGLERSKHSAVIAAFRQHFVKTGIIEADYSDIYGAVMEDRAEGDYDIEFAPGVELAERDLERAQRFLARIERALQEMGIAV